MASPELGRVEDQTNYKVAQAWETKSAFVGVITAALAVTVFSAAGLVALGEGAQWYGARRVKERIKEHGGVIFSRRKHK